MIPSSYKPIEGESPPSLRDNQTPSVDQPTVKWHRRLLQKIQGIDRGFIVSKLFYFFFYTALGALFPFFSLFYKQLWLSPGQTGILLALRPSVKLICLPLWKMVTDKYSKPKVVYFISIFGWVIGYYGQTFVFPSDLPCYTKSVAASASGLLNSTSPSLMNEKKTHFISNLTSRDWSERDSNFDWNGKILNTDNLKGPKRQFMAKKSKKVEENFEQERTFEVVNSRDAVVSGSSHLNKQAGIESQMNIEKHSKQPKSVLIDSNVERRQRKRNNNEKKHGVDEEEPQVSTLRNEKKDSTSIQSDAGASYAYHQENKLQKPIEDSGSSTRLNAFRNVGYMPSPKPKEDFRVKYNYWVFRALIVIVILTEIITTPTPMLADSAVIQSIANTDSEYGRQRLFGSLGLALSAVLVGFFASTDCPYTDTVNYLPCFYIFEIALAATVLVSLFFKFETLERKEDEIGLLEGLKMFKNPRSGFFLVTILVLGFCHSLQISFLFWFLQDIGGTPILFAIIILVYCFAEVVMYFISNYVIQAIGQQGLLCLALGCYTARFLMYGNLKDPWLIIPMEMVQGVTYGGVWSVAVTYVPAPPEASSMVQSILHGTYWGVGMAAGSLVSGVVIENFSAQSEFLVVSAIAFVFCILHVFLEIFDRIEAMEEESLEKRENEPAGGFIGAAAAPLVPCLLYAR